MGMRSTRKALADKNGSNESLFSHTTVSSGSSVPSKSESQPGATSDISTLSLASVGAYNEFAVSIPLHNESRAGPDPPTRCTSTP